MAAPIPRPPKILALALNSRGHLEGSKLNFFDEPIVFAKYACNLVAHEGDIELPPFPQVVDEEHELALVVSRNCRHLRPSQAHDYIFGYTICNDVSARDRQRERLKMGQPYSYAKNFASFCPMGPWIVTSRELPDPRDLKVEVRVNGEVRRKGSTADMIFDPFEVLSYCSDYTVMEAGDVISLGTYAGNKRLAAGDLVEMGDGTHRRVAQPGGRGARAMAQFGRGNVNRSAGQGRPLEGVPLKGGGFCHVETFDRTTGAYRHSRA
jgi:2,4-didehydro-3-deoxy-L-rhamnonate hydrolase